MPQQYTFQLERPDGDITVEYEVNYLNGTVDTIQVTPPSNRQFTNEILLDILNNTGGLKPNVRLILSVLLERATFHDDAL